MRFTNTLLGIVSVLFVTGFFVADNWKTTMINGDSSGYYFHVVAAFVNQDVGDYTRTIDDYLEEYPMAGDPRKDIYGVRETPKGRYYIKYTLGVGIMEVPFFLAAHAVASLSEKYAADGWSRPYNLSINFSKVVYILLGFFFLTGVLKRYFPQAVVVITVLSLAFGTNLFYHGTFLTLAHSFLFFDFCLLIYLSIRFYERPGRWRAFGLGAVVGLIAITRVPEVIGLLVPVLWGVTSWEKFRERLQFFLKNYDYLLVAAAGLLLVFSPQLAYWYYVSGEFFFNPYKGETFNFLNPRIHKGWFHFHNGWLIYTPIMLLSLIGCFFLRRKAAGALLPLLGFVLLNAWIHYSYYAWSFFPGFGSRPMIDGYPLLAFGLAAFYDRLWPGRASRWVAIGLFAVFTALNLFQTWQMRKGIIWSERGSLPFYWETFGATGPSLEALRAYDSHTFQPDSSRLRLIDTIYANPFEDTTAFQLTEELAYSGRYALFNTTDQALATVTFTLGDHDIQAGDWMYLEVKAYRKAEDMIWARDQLENLVLEVRDEKDKVRRWTSIKIASHIGNENANIWHVGTPGQWGTAAYFVRIPRTAAPDWRIRAFIWNEPLNRLYLDDMVLLHYRGS